MDEIWSEASELAVEFELAELEGALAWAVEDGVEEEEEEEVVEEEEEEEEDLDVEFVEPALGLLAPDVAWLGLDCCWRPESASTCCWWSRSWLLLGGLSGASCCCCCWNISWPPAP